MEHTFLFQEGLWTTEGKYFDAESNIIPVKGESKITHLQDIWLNNGYMALFKDIPIEFQDKYKIVPFEDDKDMTTWESFNPSLGVLIGKFVVIDDSIISSFVAENGRYSGHECLTKVSDTEYKNIGVIFKGENKLYSWSVKLTKTE